MREIAAPLMQKERGGDGGVAGQYPSPMMNIEIESQIKIAETLRTVRWRGPPRSISGGQGGNASESISLMTFGGTGGTGGGRRNQCDP